MTRTWGLSAEQAHRYVPEARNVVKSDLSDIDRVDMLASKVQMLEQIATDAVAAGRENSAILFSSHSNGLLKCHWLILAPLN
ncbi:MULTISPECIES: hypothetical protein [unclassified Synechococcus]|uniref:hypothetical protein n=1 Tax=unclassified Synechococcus TaxID=2626047 RepID=UPI0012E7E663|nr:MULTISPECIES: hypothetical protein [unclassified Synechococcus]